MYNEDEWWPDYALVVLSAYLLIPNLIYAFHIEFSEIVCSPQKSRHDKVSGCRCMLFGIDITYMRDKHRLELLQRTTALSTPSYVKMVRYIQFKYNMLISWFINYICQNSCNSCFLLFTGKNVWEPVLRLERYRRNIKSTIISSALQCLSAFFK